MEKTSEMKEKSMKQETQKKSGGGVRKFLVQDENHVIEAHELAKDGIVNRIYPLEGNEEAMGLNMLEQIIGTGY